MNELTARWVAALRSGDYQQGRGALNVDGKLCCLGVLCEVAGLTAVARSTDPLAAPLTYGGNTLLPPTRVQVAANLTPNDVERLTTMNDAERATFCDIADWLEARS